MTNSNAMVQIPFELDMLEAGRERYKKIQEGMTEQGLLTTPQMKLLTGALPLVSKRLKEDIEDADKGGKGKTAQWVLPLSILDADVVAFVGLNRAFYAVAKSSDVRKVAKSIGQYINMEIWAMELEKADPKLYGRILSKAQKHSSYDYRKKATTAIAGKSGFTFDRWEDEFCIRVGSAVLNAVLSSSGIFEVWDKPEGRNNIKKMVGLTPEALEIIQDMEESSRWMTPYFKPMSVPPKPWENLDTGCYIDEALSFFVPLVRTFDSEHKKLIKDAIRKGTMNPVLKAVNAIQEVPLRINTTVYEMVKACWDNDAVVGKLPSRKTLEIPKVPENWFQLDDDHKKLWKRNKEKIILRNRAIEADIMNIAQDLATAREYIEMGVFYLPHSLDFRGRVYPVPVFNHQRSDHIRSMFEFVGYEWLPHHITWGTTKTWGPCDEYLTNFESFLHTNLKGN